MVVVVGSGALSYALEAAVALYPSDTASFFDKSPSCAVGTFSKATQRPPIPHRIDAARSGVCILMRCRACRRALEILEAMVRL